MNELSLLEGRGEKTLCYWVLFVVFTVDFKTLEKVLWLRLILPLQDIRFVEVVMMV